VIESALTAVTVPLIETFPAPSLPPNPPPGALLALGPNPP
jgi:hypothetical protein